MPRFTAASDEERREHAISEIARTRAEIHGRMLAVGLQRLAGRYGAPDEDELTELLCRGGRIDVSVASSLARCFVNFWRADLEACVHVAAPKVEAAARTLLIELDEGIYRAQVAQDPGGYPGLFNLLTALERIALDESWAYFLNWLLLGPLGMNIRNDVAHGYVGQVSPSYAALVLRAFGLLASVAPPPPPGFDDPHPSTDLRTDEDRNAAKVDLMAALNTPVSLPARWPRDARSHERLAATIADGLRWVADRLAGPPNPSSLPS